MSKLCEEGGGSPPGKYGLAPPLPLTSDPRYATASSLLVHVVLYVSSSRDLDLDGILWLNVVTNWFKLVPPRPFFSVEALWKTLSIFTQILLQR